MKIDKIVLYLALQFLAVTGLVILDMTNQPPGIVRGVLFAALFILSGMLLLIRLRFLSKVKGMVEALNRAVRGNVNTRLLAKGDPAFDEVIFSINELIEQLDKLGVRTIKSEAARKSLLTNISHDIRTPLTSIIGYADALKDDIAASPELKREYVEIISRKAGALKELIEEIFHLAKLDADEAPMKPEAVDFAEIARESVIAFLPELQMAGMELQVSIPEGSCMVLADRLSMLRIVNNLMKNAVQYGAEGKAAGIELTEYNAEYELCVWDKGAGIAAEDLPRIFERMYRTDRSRSSGHGGSGLGLAIAKALVEKNGGVLLAESEPGRKTAFRFSIPKRSRHSGN
ncbi:sensor histidine kinase [Paenibacillus sp. MBLB4367]|uniref:sensor histidine kinase n=1 Tax=Paenibacillus sp. MBLB4367 TaxID=3384767 RepID=UPI00390807B6